MMKKRKKEKIEMILEIKYNIQKHSIKFIFLSIEVKDENSVVLIYGYFTLLNIKLNCL